eukprot:5066783-Pyramimonas_sp.AAC.1
MKRGGQLKQSRKDWHRRSARTKVTVYLASVAALQARSRSAQGNMRRAMVAAWPSAGQQVEAGERRGRDADADLASTSRA